MITVNCIYANGEEIRTNINGTLQDAKQYFLGQFVNIGHIEDNVQQCVEVREIFLYEIASNYGVTYHSFDEITQLCEVVGWHENPRTRRELQDQPLLSLTGIRLCGPMYGGKKDNKTVIRYETQEHYNTYD